MNVLANLLAAVMSVSVGAAPPPPPAPSENGQVVVLLHGLARSADSMRDMQRALEAAGYRVCNIAYPSREHSIAELAVDHVAPRISACVADADAPLHFVTHSLGGIIVRQLVATRVIRKVGRVVMLGPPNHGSEVVDALGSGTLFGLLNGPAGRELGTAPTSVPDALGPATVSVGVVAGNRSINGVLSLIIPGPDDGKVSIASAHLEGMQDFVVVPAAHPFLMTNHLAIEQTLRFLSTGSFLHEHDWSLRCSGA